MRWGVNGFSFLGIYAVEIVRAAVSLEDGAACYGFACRHQD